MTRLTEIANKHNTDKGTVAYEAHGYTKEYAKYIPNSGKYDMLEIGYWHGDSARMWKEYNPELNLTVMDIDTNCIQFVQEGDNYHLIIADAAKEQSVLSSMSWDFIIDDGSHRYEDILASFKLLYPKLRPGGYYFIEDLHAPQAQKFRLYDEIETWLKKEYGRQPLQLISSDSNGKLLILQKKP